MAMADMDRKILNIFIFLIYVKPEAGLSIGLRKLNYQKDMSEYCRRRVVPSVFLGKQVMAPSSYIMHFSQLEVPYSCTLSVRTESGSNIILVIQLLSGITLVEACNRNADQLIVYDFGETFGGYWGHLPDTMIKETAKNYTHYYTLQATETTITSSTKNSTSLEEILMQKQPLATNREKDFIRMEIPLVNVSGNFQLRPMLQSYYADAEEMFDFMYDVAPRNGVEYTTSVLPLVQFSIKKQKVGPDSYGMERRYDLDYAVDGFTIDSRLLFSTENKRVSTKKRKWPTSRRFSFRKKNVHKLSTAWQRSSFTRSRFPTRDSLHWEIKEPLKSVGKTTIRSTTEYNNTRQDISDKIYNIDYNHINDREIDHISSDTTSVKDQSPAFNISDDRRFTSQSDFYINQSSYMINDEYQVTKVNEKAFTKIHDRNGIKERINEVNVVKPNDLNKDISKIRELNNRRNIVKSNLLQRGKLVDHESWENVVQAAPVMAVVLNNTKILNTNITRDTKVDRSNKNKRHVKAIEIERSRPKNLTTQRTVVADAEMEYQISDMQNLAELVELQDDEIAGRLALRYLRNYVGSVLFNICDFQEAKSRQVFLFNASRIVIAINNFSLEDMTLVLTPAQSLLGSLSLCEPGYLECQIVGSRVCIDSMNACDAVPNCGSSDIYDEDRLKCGGTEGLQHNVYLAAITLLAVILTMLYTIYYWLKRCVPKVSDAFFIYSDVSENTLFLDTIMHSPNDVDDGTTHKLSDLDHFFDNNSSHEDGYKEDHLNENLFEIIMRKCWRLLFCKKERQKHQDYKDDRSAPLHHSKVSSFTEFELRKFTRTRNEAAQTGDSIELQFKTRKKWKTNHENIMTDSLDQLKVISDQRARDKYTDELNLIKFAKETRSSSQCDAIRDNQRDLGMRNAFTVHGEKEIKNTLYERESNIKVNQEKILVKCEVHPEKPKRHAATTRLLRFDEALTIIPSMESGGEITVDTMDSRRSVNLGTGGQSNLDLDIIKQVEGSEGSDNRDFRHFMGMAKAKKSKKKKEKHLPIRFN